MPTPGGFGEGDLDDTAQDYGPQSSAYPKRLPASSVATRSPAPIPVAATTIPGPINRQLGFRGAAAGEGERLFAIAVGNRLHSARMEFCGSNPSSGDQTTSLDRKRSSSAFVLILNEAVWQICSMPTVDGLHLGRRQEFGSDCKAQGGSDRSTRAQPTSRPAKLAQVFAIPHLAKRSVSTRTVISCLPIASYSGPSIRLLCKAATQFVWRQRLRA